MKAIMTGTIAGGFVLSAIVPDEQAEDVVIKLLADGKLAEAMEINDPATLDESAEATAGGTYFIAFGAALPGGGIDIYGPFADEEEAEDLAEINRGDGEEWSLLNL